jgi:mono/diheme cytochrome c family protein
MRFPFALTVTVLLAGAGMAQAAGDAGQGHGLARQWCTGCHLVDGDGPARDTAPPFPDIARKHGDDRRWLKAWLNTSHPHMPNFNLARSEIDDLTAYLASLAPH